MSDFDRERERLGRQLEARCIDRQTFIREREAINRREREAIRAMGEQLRAHKQ